MPIEKLPEFAKGGQKNTDDLTLLDGFPVGKKPARQWFNYLFNMLSLKINEIIDLNPVARSEIVDNLTTNDAARVLSAAQGKVLNEKMTNIPVYSLPTASTTTKGGVKVGTGLRVVSEVLSVSLNNTLTSTSVAEALTANMGRELALRAFGIGQTRKKDTLVLNTTYTNTSSKPWFVSMTAKNTSPGQAALLWLKVNGNAVAASQDVATLTGSGSSVYTALVTIEQIILPGESFIFENNGSGRLECSSEIS